MKTLKTNADTGAPTKTSRVGRRPKGDGSEGSELSRDKVIQCAVALARRESIEEVSIARVARDLGVVPGLIHYYIGNRGDLLSAVINLAYKERFEALPPITGEWRADLEGVARSSLQAIDSWPGLATYIATHNRFRLFQRVLPGEIDYGLAYFDHLGRILEQSGFTPTQAALVYQLLMMFVTAIAAENANRQAPAEHEEFIVGYVSSFDKKCVPGASYIVRSFAKIDNTTAFDAGLQLLLDGVEAWQVESPRALGSRRRGK